MLFKALTTAVLLATSVSAFPKVHPAEFRRIVQDAAASGNMPEIRDGQIGRLIQFEPPMAFNGTKKIPGQSSCP
jgi:hypothetical protein